MPMLKQTVLTRIRLFVDVFLFGRVPELLIGGALRIILG